MFDASAITSYINIILSFIFDNIGFVIGILIVLFSIRSSLRKKRRAEAENDGETQRKKSLREIMAEIESELNKDEEDNAPAEEGPAARPYDEPEPKVSPWQQREKPKRKDTPWTSMEPAPEGPGEERVKPSVFDTAAAPQQPSVTFSTFVGENSASQHQEPLPEIIDIRIAAPPMEVQEDADECATNGYFRKKKIGPGEMIDAVVMAEILAKPKALRKAGERL